jgi:hypothetical protein
MQARSVMRILVVVAALLVCGCRERMATDDDRVGMRKPVESDDDFLHTRGHFESQMRDRLARLNVRINELGNDASVQLRAQRDQIAMLVEKIDDQGESDWDGFRSKLERSFSEVEQQLTNE